MSDQQQGPGWWLASDGRWYPPEQAAGAAAPAPTEAAGSPVESTSRPVESMPAPTEVAGSPVESTSRPVGSTPPPVGSTPRPFGLASSPEAPSSKKTGRLVVGAVILVALIVAAALVLSAGDDDDGDLVADTTSTTAPDDAEPTDGDEPTTDGESTDADGGEPGDAVRVPDGFTMLEGDGVAMAVPDSWVQIDADDADLSPEELAELYPGASPELLEQGLAAFEQGAVLVATDIASSTFQENVNVLRVPSEIPLDTLEAQGEQEIAALGGQVDSVDRVVLPAGDAVRLAYSLEGVAPDGRSFSVRGLQHYVPFDGSTYVITVSSDEDPGEVGELMAETFRVR